MKNVFFCLLPLCFFICSCGDSDSPSMPDFAENVLESSSSVQEMLSSGTSSIAESSSSKKKVSSSSSSVREARSSSVSESSSVRVASSSSLPTSSELTPEVSSSSVEALSSEAVSSSSVFFEPPKGSVNNPKSLTFEEVYANSKEFLLQNFFAQDSIEIEYSMEMSKISSYANEVKYISNGKNHLYLFLSNEVGVLEPVSVALKLQNKPTKRIVRDSVRKVVLLTDKKSQKESFILITSERYKDSIRTEYGMCVPFMLDSGTWQQPVQITDELFELKNDLGHTAYYNLSKKSIEAVHWIETNEDDVTVETVIRYFYDDDGYVNIFTMDVESRKSERMAGALVKTEIKSRKSGTVIPEEWFDF